MFDKYIDLINGWKSANKCLINKYECLFNVISVFKCYKVYLSGLIVFKVYLKV
jgi:hypothetical protein